MIFECGLLLLMTMKQTFAMQIWLNGKAIDANADWKVRDLKCAAKDGRRGYVQLAFGGEELLDDSQYLADAGIGAEAVVSELGFVDLPVSMRMIPMPHEVDAIFSALHQRVGENLYFQHGYLDGKGVYHIDLITKDANEQFNCGPLQSGNLSGSEWQQITHDDVFD